MTKPFKFQKEVLNEIEWFDGRAMIALPPGAGKTFIALTYGQRHPELRPIVVVCPAGVKYQWAREAGVHVQMAADILEGQKPTRRGLKTKSPLTIVNYDIVQYWLPYLLKLKPEVLVLDEFHYIMNSQTKRSKAIRKLARNVEHIIVLSGTPFMNRPIELWNPCNILWPEREFFATYSAFGHEFCGAKRDPFSGGWDFTGSSHIPKLRRRLLKAGMIRRNKKQIMPDMPAKTRTVVPFQMEDPGEYRHAAEDFQGWLRETLPNKSHLGDDFHITALQRVGYLKRLAAWKKMPSVFRWADEFLDTEEKLVLFAIHNKIITALKERYGDRCVVIDGSVSPKKRRLIVDQFTHNKRTQLFIGNIKAAGTGLDGLQRKCRKVGFVEMWWNPATHQQAEGRVAERIGSSATDVVYMVARDSIEEKVCALIQKRQETIAAALDGGTEQGESLSVFDELMKSLEKESSNVRAEKKNLPSVHRGRGIRRSSRSTRTL